jgi:hypothetical protein
VRHDEVGLLVAASSGTWNEVIKRRLVGQHSLPAPKAGVLLFLEQPCLQPPLPARIHAAIVSSTHFAPSEHGGVPMASLY